MIEQAAPRTGGAERSTSETDVRASVNLDGKGEASVSTGVPFLDHMLHALSKHSRISISVQARGDVEIDDHHTVEDVALTLGRALRGALGDRTGIARFGHAYAPLDEALARVVVDISGRPYAVYRADGLGPYVGTFQTYLAAHFFRSLAQEAGMALHVELLYGADPHHSIEAMFKALALALKAAVAVVGGGVPSTKGALD
ncbi:MAG: imidazoleglycerol-phosphate dehydratase HisB [Chloroflexota bacterium]|nr:imidazoleglycerol-phosphate dehydratase HisB [Chloroflexota bacterium]